MIEIIAILILLGIISAVAVVTISGNQNELISQSDALISYIKYAQAKSMGTTARVFGIGIDASHNRYWMFSCNSTGACTWQDTKELLPGAQLNPAFDNTGTGDQIQTSKVNVDIAGSDAAIVFDKIGRPFQATTGSITYVDPLSDTTELTQLSTAFAITLNDQKGHSKIITIIPETGFIQ